jgi:hypothetical protein
VEGNRIYDDESDGMARDEVSERLDCRKLLDRVVDAVEVHALEHSSTVQCGGCGPLRRRAALRDAMQALDERIRHLQRAWRKEGSLGIDVHRIALHATEWLRNLHVERELDRQLRLAHARYARELGQLPQRHAVPEQRVELAAKGHDAPGSSLLLKNAPRRAHRRGHSAAQSASGCRAHGA